MKITVVGAGSAGAMASVYLKTKFPEYDIIILHSEDIPTLGVGESVTPYITRFFDDIGLDEKQWMPATNSIYKYANCFSNWTSDNEEHFFAFTYNQPVDKVLNQQPITWNDLKNIKSTDTRLTDLWIQSYKNKTSKYYSEDFNFLHPFMKDLKAPFVDGKYIGHKYSYAYHIDANKLGPYLLDIAKQRGVSEIIGTITKINHSQKIDSVEVDGVKHTSDLWIDATGFANLLINTLTTEYHYYDNTANSAWVAPLEYTDFKQMKNYTESIWHDLGWIFKIGLSNRQGCGLVYSDEYFDDDTTKQAFLKYTNGRCMQQPRLLKWQPKRLKTPAVENVFSIGIGCGFVEPMEANALYLTVASIKGIERYLNSNDINDYNQRITYTLDDIADFIDVHYTLCSKGDNKFWNDCRERGIKKSHAKLLQEKYFNKKSTIEYAVEYWTMFPDYMWVELTSAWLQHFSEWNVYVDTQMIQRYKEIISKQKQQIQTISNNANDYYNFIEELHNV